MKKLFICVISISLLSCQSKQASFEEVAKDLCGCYSIVEKDMPNLKLRIIQSARELSPLMYVKAYVENAKNEGSTSISTELGAMGSLDEENTAAGECYKKLKDKYKNSFNLKDEKAGKMLVKELKMQGCEFGSAMHNLKWTR